MISFHGFNCGGSIFVLVEYLILNIESMCLEEVSRIQHMQCRVVHPGNLHLGWTPGVDLMIILDSSGRYLAKLYYFPNVSLFVHMVLKWFICLPLQNFGDSGLQDDLHIDSPQCTPGGDLACTSCLPMAPRHELSVTILLPGCTYLIWHTWDATGKSFYGMTSPFLRWGALFPHQGGH